MSNYAEELRRRVDEILYYIWDPIGVAAEPSTRDEYERYVAGLISLLEKNADSKQVAAYLDDIAKNRMGLHPNDKHSLASRETRAGTEKLAAQALATGERPRSLIGERLKAPCHVPNS